MGVSFTFVNAIAAAGSIIRWNKLLLPALKHSIASGDGAVRAAESELLLVQQMSCGFHKHAVVIAKTPEHDECGMMNIPSCQKCYVKTMLGPAGKQMLEIVPTLYWGNSASLSI